MLTLGYFYLNLHLFSICSSFLLGAGYNREHHRQYYDCTNMLEINLINKNMKKSILLLKLIMLLPIVASAHDFYVDGIYYSIINDSEVAVTYMGSYSDQYSNDYSGDVVIPDTVVFNEVTYFISFIDDEAFENCSRLTSIDIPNTVTSIGRQAFFGCSDLTSVSIPNSVIYIGDQAFEQCTKLESIEIPNSVSFIGNEAFLSTPWYWNQPDGLIYAGLVAYKYKGTMPTETHITIADGSLAIGVEAFAGCDGLTSIEIPCSVTAIGGGAFAGCSSLVNISIPTSVTSIGPYAFSHCSGLTSITIPNSITSIGEAMFWNCTGITSIEIPNSVTSIGREAFSGCSGLTSVTIPNSVTNIEIQTFLNCTSLASVVIPNSVTSINVCAFKGCSGLTSVTIPSSTTYIGYSAFEDCSGLTSITIPESVDSIGEYAFKNCLSLTELIFNAKKCGSFNWSKHPFSNTNITNIIIGDSVKIIPDYFAYRNMLICTMTLGNSVTNIGNGSFEYCAGLTSITIPNSVTSIGSTAFKGCTGLNNVEIPNSVAFIGEGVFVECYNLESVTLPNTISSISRGLFSNCSKLASIVIPNSVTEIGESAFYCCIKLTGIDIPNSVTAIGNYAFGYCRGLTSIEIPNSVTCIGNVAFCNCINLTDIVIPNSVTSIGADTFYGCSNIVNLIITGEGDWQGDALSENSGWICRPSRLIIDSRITSVKGMKVYPYSVYSYSIIPPTCDENSFIDYSGTLHVPASSLAAYFTADYWCNFANIVGDAVELDEVIISQDTVEVNLGNLFNLTVTLTPTNAAFNNLRWQFNPDVVCIVGESNNNTYTFEAVGVGECDIIVRCMNKKAICHVVVNDTTVKITLDQQEAMVLPNHIITLTPIPNPIVPDLTVSSSDPSVAAARVVNNKIQVVGIKEGTTTITVDSADGTAIPATCLVTVYTEPGDLDCDGFVNISDVTSLIDYLLSGDTQINTKNADVDGDGTINISDVTELIDILLKGD